MRLLLVAGMLLAIASCGLLVPSLASAAISSQQARGWAREAVRTERPAPKRLTAACRVDSSRASCRVAWRERGRRYRGTVALVKKTTVVRYTLRAKGTARGRRALRVVDSGGIEITPAPGESRERPIPYGATGRNGDWQITVVGTEPDATARVMAENQFNDPPAPGNQFYIARVRATYTGEDSEKFDGSFRLRAVGASSVAYTTFNDSCGVIPDPISDNDVFTGGTIEGNVCWQIRSTDAPSLVMFDEPFLSERQLFFALS